MHPIEPYQKIAQRYAKTQATCTTIPPHYLKNYTPIFEYRLLPLINTHPFGTPPPPDNDGVCEHNAMQPFPQKKISHNTTDKVTKIH